MRRPVIYQTRDRSVMANYTGAQELYERALNLHPESVPAMTNLAVLLVSSIPSSAALSDQECACGQASLRA